MTNDLVKQPALRRWQESVYGKGPYQVPDYESMAAIVQEHEQMADRIEELEAKLSKSKALLAKAMKALAQIGKTYTADKNRLIHGDLWIIETVQTTLAELKGETDG
jgi:hypothetical protein